MTKNVLMVGFGSQGRNHSLNLRDSGWNVVIHGLEKDRQDAADQEFQLFEPKSASSRFDVLFLLAPDDAHKKIFESLKSFLKPGAIVVVAHGFSIYYKELLIDEAFDWAMLAPRMPGAPVREAYLKGESVPAFVDLIYNGTGTLERKFYDFAKDCGYSETTLKHVTVREETEIDLFIEQFFLPRLFELFQGSYQFLTAEGMDPEVVLLELFASGELSELLNRAAVDGLHTTWRNHASPTCRFGIYENLDMLGYSNTLEKKMDGVLHSIRNKTFLDKLKLERSVNFSHCNKLEADYCSSELEKQLKLLGAGSK